jgi:hypothetical protein
MVTGYAANGRLAVSFDNGQSHNYKPASVALKIVRQQCSRCTTGCTAAGIGAAAVFLLRTRVFGG